MVAHIVPTLFQGPYGERLAGYVIGLMADQMADGASFALMAPWIQRDEFPSDAAAPLGRESNFEAYAGEATGPYIARIRRRWDDWPFAGDESSIVGQLAAAGYPGCEVRFYTARPGPHGEDPPYWSQFWVYFPPGTHPIQIPTRRVAQFNVGAGIVGGHPYVGGFNVGEMTVGPIGLTAAFYSTLRGIVRKWKPGHWVCRGFVFGFVGSKVGEFNVGTGTVAGDVEMGDS